ncbi:BREX-3 system phosphatase PglZ [Archangium violaceum]|uniref:BREX-3 system phosphatase PglZ n=1 Tax=Archangium violaceum TaxID=83451 RepID=UPI002B310DBD|nr:BREX-3 system phosphatase PglZ [Archangium gephyra]
MTQRRDGWRGPILQHFSEASAKAGRLTVVSDPDELLTEPGVVERLAARGFELITFGDPVAFRYAYESRFRQHWDRGEATHLVVVIRTDHGDLKHIPHDLLEEARESGRVLSFSLVHLFPSLAPNVVAELDPQHFDALAHAFEHANPGNLGTNATRDFVLRHVFEIAPELIKQPADLLRVLLRRHYRSQVFPESLDARFIEVLTQSPKWRSWPLERIVPDREAFLSFLGERWPRFLLSKGLEAVPGREPAGPSISGPTDLPFDHDDVRVYMDNLFVEGLLEPTTAVRPNDDDRWFAVGIAGSPASSSEGRFFHLLDELSATIPSPDGATYQEWQDYSLRWGTWVRLRWKTLPERDSQSEAGAIAFANRVQTAFSTWLLRRFGPMSTLPYLPRPVLGHHVPHYLAHHLGQPGTERVALLVIDGMAIDQWRILRDTLDGHYVDEHAIFSWIPTLTQIGRQAIFSGRIPLEFATSIEGTHREPLHWSNFWQDRGLPERAIRYLKPQGKKESFEQLAADILGAADDGAVRVIGAVIGLIDQSMHQVGLGTPGLHGLVEVWSRTKQLAGLVDELLQRGFAVFITADHGNVFGRGFGKPDVGATAQQRGERAHIFRNKDFRDNTAPLYPNAIEWPQIGLPQDYFPLIAPYGACFMPEGKEAVSHGGIALEEVMVPFVRITGGR